MGDGKIVKIAKGAMHINAHKDIHFYAKNINANAGSSVGETAEGGVVFGTPQTTNWDMPNVEFPNHNYTPVAATPSQAAAPPSAAPQTKQHTAAPEAVEESEISSAKKIKLTIAVFFDGTLNNKYNTNARIYYDKIKVLGKENELDSDQKEQAKAFKRRWFDLREGSYINDLSNVARLEKFYNLNPISKHHFVEKIYVEGVGTRNGGGDDIFSAKDGEGHTGMRNKIEKSIESISKVINKKFKESFIIEELIFNVYGFSRGAATARNFVHEITQEAGAYKAKGNRGRNLYYTNPYGLLGETVDTSKIEQLTINFAGLFDTVSAHNKDGIDQADDHHNDIDELHLNDIKKAKETVHFIAENENRFNFSLTRIPKGVEKEFPGVHADIGGCYETGYEIVDEVYYGTVEKLRKEKKKLIEQSWFKEKGELTESNVINIGSPNSKNISKLTGKRYIYKNYSFIFLELMALKSHQNNTIKIEMPQLLDDFDIHKIDPYVVNYKKGIFAGREKNPIKSLIKEQKETLSYTRKRLKNYLFYDDLPMKYYTPTELDAHKWHPDLKLMQKDTKALKVLRNQFLHFSANYDGFGMDPRRDKEGNTYRKYHTKKAQ